MIRRADLLRISGNVGDRIGLRWAWVVEKDRVCTQKCSFSGGKLWHFSNNGFFAMKGGSPPEVKEESEEYGEGMKQQLQTLGNMLTEDCHGAAVCF